MSFSLLTTTAFEKQGGKLEKLEAVVNLLQSQQLLPTRLQAPPIARELDRALGLPR